MKLRTSFFNTAVLKKDITRFAPLWGLYTVFMLLVLFVIRDGNSTPVAFAREADDIMRAMGVVNFGYAGLAALCLFGDLFKSRLAGALHAMPLRREGWFFTHLASGMLFCLIPNALGAVISAAMLGPYAYLAYAWLGLMLMQYLCFFAIGVFSVMCTGNILGAGAVYGLLNFLSILILWLVKCFYEPVLFGVTVQGQGLLYFSPAVGFSLHSFVEFDRELEQVVFTSVAKAGWLYAALAALVGVGLLTAALFIYRKRQLESAGDFIAFRPAGPVFLVLYALCVGALLYLFAEAVGNEGMKTGFLLIGLAIGWFTGLMLLQKRVNVFRVKTCVGFGVLVFAFFLSVSVAWLDPIGITRYVPEAGQVKTVMVAPYTSDYYFGAHSAYVTDEATIERLTQIHQRLVERRSENEAHMVLRLRYTMKTGVETERQYRINVNSEDGQWLKTVYSRPEAVLGSGDLGAMKRAIRYGEAYGFAEELMVYPETKDFWKIETEDHAGLLDALYADCQAGNMAQMWEYHEGEKHVANLNIQFGQGSYRDILVFESSVNTVAYLKTLAAKQVEANLQPTE